MKKLLFLFTLIFFSNFLFSQADCIKPLIYSGKINIKKFSIDKIFVPSTVFLSKVVKFNELGGFKVFEPTSEKFYLKTSTNLSSHFCGEPQEIINDFFKKAKFYPIKITEKMKDHVGEYRTLEFKIPVEKMIFKITEDHTIEITFPDISL